MSVYHCSSLTLEENGHDAEKSVPVISYDRYQLNYSVREKKFAS